MSKPRILVIIPCYNEQETIAPLLRDISACGHSYETLVIDDGSKDATYEIASQFSPTVRLLKHLGIGSAVQTGIKYAYAKGFDFCVHIDGDGQHPPSEISKLLQAYQDMPRSLLIGNRYLQRDSSRLPRIRRWGERTIAWALNLLFTCRITDPTSGMRLMDKQAIAFFAHHYPRDLSEPLSLAWALKEKLAVGEVSVSMRARHPAPERIAYILRVLGDIILARLTGPVPLATRRPTLS